jgi:hypothetical protein
MADVERVARAIYEAHCRLHPPPINWPTWGEQVAQGHQGQNRVREFLSYATAAIAAMEGWRPIEEAPKRNDHENTEEFLGYSPTRPKETRICIIFWMPSENRFGILGGSGVRDKLTHFRPKPAPPQHGGENG